MTLNSLHNFIIKLFSWITLVTCSYIKHQNCQKDADHGYNHKNNLEVEIFKNFGQNWANFDKKCNFLQNAIYSKLHFAL